MRPTRQGCAKNFIDSLVDPNLFQRDGVPETVFGESIDIVLRRNVVRLPDLSETKLQEYSNNLVRYARTLALESAW
jgi:hypothetical protein